MLNGLGKTDSQIQKDVLNELTWDPRVTATQINVTASDGIVTLRGTVPHYFEKSTAEEVAQRVAGVRAVADELEVDLMGSYERGDEDIARAALNVLQWNYAVPKDVKVAVEKGWVTLKGEVEWDYQRNIARNAISQLMGVRGVKNNITIRSRVQPADIKIRIEEALKRSAEREGRMIGVEVKGDRVILSGHVHCLTESQDARLAAFNAPGVLAVENRLSIG